MLRVEKILLKDSIFKLLGNISEELERIRKG